MSRSFDIVDTKVEECEFFLTKLGETIELWPMSQEPQFYLSAFASATRSITFTIQASISDIPNFAEWYEKHRINLKNNKLAKYFVEARNSSQKIGYYLIGGRQSNYDEQANKITHFYFQYISNFKIEDFPDEDVLLSCNYYFKALLEIVRDCYIVFGTTIDPEKFFTYENLVNSNKTIEDFEEQAGYPRGHTNIPGFSIKERIDLISRHHPSSRIDWIIEKYLGTNRFGENDETN
ncbi:MAG: hypothetical protein NTW29_21600 [Bacteroidetes bacterium]|nr:hypothetical protein [Bacteroidota bacterium]